MFIWSENELGECCKQAATVCELTGPVLLRIQTSKKKGRWYCYCEFGCQCGVQARDWYYSGHQSSIWGNGTYNSSSCWNQKETHWKVSSYLISFLMNAQEILCWTLHSQSCAVRFTTNVYFVTDGVVCKVISPCTLCFSSASFFAIVKTEIIPQGRWKYRMSWIHCLHLLKYF